jgi:hypothetical protein
MCERLVVDDIVHWAKHYRVSHTCMRLGGGGEGGGAVCPPRPACYAPGTLLAGLVTTNKLRNGSVAAGRLLSFSL